MKRLIILTATLLLLASVGFSQEKPLRNTRYNYKQLVRRGYQCEPFEGKIFVTYKVYQNLITNKKIK